MLALLRPRRSRRRNGRCPPLTAIASLVLMANTLSGCLTTERDPLTNDCPTATGACSDGLSSENTLASTDASHTTSHDASGATLQPPFTVRVAVTLDGEPLFATAIYQGGITEPLAFTDGAGEATVVVQAVPHGHELSLLAQDPSARVGGVVLKPEHVEMGANIALQRFATVDNPNYVFAPPQDLPNQREGCGHCHRALVDDWLSSAHRHSASRISVQDIYAGTARSIGTPSLCQVNGGQWIDLPVPGSEQIAAACKVAPAVQDLPHHAKTYGHCAACHAPALPLARGAHDLQTARGDAFTEGVHCDLCHKIESLAPHDVPGVAGWLRLLRPSEPWPGMSERNLPLSFGPYPDVWAVAMGAVYRPFFQDAALCGGCHQLDAPLPDDANPSLRSRWPSGTLPVHSTYAEWQGSALAPAITCLSCHMPPDGQAVNSITMDHSTDQPAFDHNSGWPRPAGAVRKHTFVGPRSPGSTMLQLAAELKLDKAVTDHELTAIVTVRNASQGHALPTGEPMRAMLLVVRAYCESQEIPATGGDVIADIGGSLAIRPATSDWQAVATWPGARVGDIIRVIDQLEGYRDYNGFGRFAIGVLAPEQKGMPLQEARISATIVGIAGDRLLFDRPLVAGDLAYLAEPDSVSDTWQARARAGQAGFAFARVMVDKTGKKMVAHVQAVDIASDNRLLPGQSWVSRHVFATSCATARVQARLLYRPYPFELARERNWQNHETLIAETWR